MKQQEVLKKIGGIINELSEQYQYLQSEDEHLNSLELELFVANAHFLTDHAEILRKLCSAPASKEAPAHPVENSQPLTQPEPEDVPAPLAEIIATVIPIEEVAPPTVAEKPVAEEEPSMIQQEEPQPVTEEPLPVAKVEHEPAQVPQFQPEAHPLSESAPEPVPEINLGGEKDTYSYIRQSPELASEETSTFDISSHVSEEPASRVSTVADVLKKEEPVATAKPVTNFNEPPVVKAEQPPVQTLNQRLSAQFSNGAANTAHATPKPVSDLKSAISLNDKLLFVRDLFNGYNLAYSEAVELLNRCKNFDEADQLLKANYTVKNNWQSKQTTADKFYALLHRRFE